MFPQFLKNTYASKSGLDMRNAEGKVLPENILMGVLFQMPRWETYGKPFVKDLQLPDYYGRGVIRLNRKGTRPIFYNIENGQDYIYITRLSLAITDIRPYLFKDNVWYFIFRDKNQNILTQVIHGKFAKTYRNRIMEISPNSPQIKTNE